MTRFVKGEWNALCQRCGFEFKSSQIALEWTGLRVCRGRGTNDCWEERHPQERVRGRKDDQLPPWTSPEPEDVFVTTPITRDDL